MADQTGDFERAVASSDEQRAEPRDHFVQFYQHDDALVDCLADFIGEGLASGAAAIVVATPDHAHALSARCAARGIDAAEARRSGRYVPLDAEQTLRALLVDGWPDADRFRQTLEPLFAQAAGRHPRVVVFGEMVRLLWAQGRQSAAVRLEELWNALRSKYAFQLLCAYPMNEMASAPWQAVHRVCGEHSHAAITDANWRSATEDERLAELRELQARTTALERDAAKHEATHQALQDAEARADRTRALLAAIVESSDDAIVSKSLDGLISSWNEGARRLFGYTADEAIGKSIMLIIPPDQQEEERQILARIARGERIEHFETVRIAKDGRRVDVSLTISPVRDGDGCVIGASKVARDISERRRLEERLRDADRRKDEFIAMLGHELRNPLAPIRNATELLRRTTAGNPACESLCRMLDRQVQQMTRLLDDLLDVSRITRGKIKFRRELIDIGSIVERAVEASRPFIDSRQHELRVTVPETRLPVEGDSTRLVQLITNLLNNAARYTHEGGTISLRVTRHEPWAEIHVEDNGIGIAPHMLPRIFDLFVQSDRSTELSHEGLGIGLTLVRMIAEHHRGNVEAKSAGPGLGSEFIVRLPIASAGAPLRAAAPVDVAAVTHRRIVIVDDNRDASDSLASLLRLSGHEVFVASEAATGLQMIRQIRPDLALLDIGLPGINGYELARRLRESDPAVSLAAVTGYGAPEDRERSHQAGFDHHFVKPVDVAALERVIMRLGDAPLGP